MLSALFSPILVILLTFQVQGFKTCPSLGTAKQQKSFSTIGIPTLTLGMLRSSDLMFPSLGSLTRELMSWPNPRVSDLQRSLNFVDGGIRTDIFETAEHYHMDFELPGFATDQVKVLVDENVVTIKAKREDTVEKEGTTWHLKERVSDELERRFTLPKNADMDKAKVQGKNGVLSVTIPKKNIPEKQMRSLPITTA